jgi:hypothetical protein
MSILQHDDLRALIQDTDGFRVSIYMPTHRMAVETRQDRIRLKNLLASAEERLIGEGLRRPAASGMLEPARSLLNDNLFWQHQSDGLALFLSAETSHIYRLPLNFDELTVVSWQFHIKPLLPILSGDGQFFVLAISQDQVRVLHGTRYDVDQVDLESVPSGLAEALRFDDPEKQLQFHTATRPPGGIGSRPASFHGQGGATGDEKTELLRYFQQIDRGLQELLGGRRDPLVLAGVDYLLPIYRQANTYAHLIDEGIEGNPDRSKAEDLREQAWDIVRPVFVRAREEAAALYEQLAGTDRAARDFREVVPAAYFGKVDTLFVPLGLQEWGTFDPNAGRISRHGQAEPGDQDLGDFAAIQTLLHGGSVYAVAPADVPGQGPLAALFRYP